MYFVCSVVSFSSSFFSKLQTEARDTEGEARKPQVTFRLRFLDFQFYQLFQLPSALRDGGRFIFHVFISKNFCIWFSSVCMCVCVCAMVVCAKEELSFNADWCHCPLILKRGTFYIENKFQDLCELLHVTRKLNY